MYNRILFSFKKERNSDICFEIEENWKYYAKRHKPHTKGQVLYDFLHKFYKKYIRCVYYIKSS